MPERIEGLITRIDGQKAFGELFIRSISDLSQVIPDMKIRQKVNKELLNSYFP